MDSVNRYDNQQELEEKVKQWLRAAIQRLEAQRAASGPPK